MHIIVVLIIEVIVLKMRIGPLYLGIVNEIIHSILFPSKEINLKRPIEIG